MTTEQRKARFIDRLQAVACPVCRGTTELRRSTWEDAERKMEQLSVFQEKHGDCFRTGVPPARPIRVETPTLTPLERAELAWKVGMKQHFGAEMQPTGARFGSHRV